MSDDSARSPKRRPVDALFGEDVELKAATAEPQDGKKNPSPGYMVEPPRPATVLRPPPPEMPNDWRAIAPTEPTFPAPAIIQETIIGATAVPPPTPIAMPIEVMEAPSEPVILMPPPGPVIPATPMPAPVPAPIPAAVLAPARTAPPVYGQGDLLELSQFVDQLYQNVAEETSDSAALSAECQGKLRSARAAIEKGNFTAAEYDAEQVKARLLRARTSRQAASEPTTRLIFGGLILVSVLSVVVLLLPVFLRLIPAVIPILRSVALGALGGAIAAAWLLARAIARRDYDPANNSRLALSPLFGAVVGGVMWLLSVLGILAAAGALGISAEPYALLYLFAFLGGLANDVIVETLRSFWGMFRRRQGA